MEEKFHHGGGGQLYSWWVYIYLIVKGLNVLPTTSKRIFRVEKGIRQIILLINPR